MSYIGETSTRWSNEENDDEIQDYLNSDGKSKMKKESVPEPQEDPETVEHSEIEGEEDPGEEEEEEKEREGDDEEDDFYLDEIAEMEDLEGLEVDDLKEMVLKQDWEEPCVCYSFDSPLHAVTYLNGIQVEKISIENFDCVIDNIIRSMVTIFSEVKELVSPFKIAAADLFYRVRHEIIFILVCWAFNLPINKSDTPFSDFGIDSDRTPDLIYEVNGLLYIIEVTAVGSLERGYQSKGDEASGFESKYKREIDMLNENKKPNKYIPLVFNMNDTTCPYDVNQLRIMESVFIKTQRMYNYLISKVKKLSLISTEIKQYLILPSMMLFSKHVPIKPCHNSHSFFYSKSDNRNVNYEYREMVISLNIYKKAINEWARFLTILERMETQDVDRVTPFINLQDSKIGVERDYNGVTCNELSSILLRYDRVSFFKSLKLKTYGGLIDVGTSDKGVKVYIKIEKRERDEVVKMGESKGSKIEEVRPFLMHKTGNYKEINFNIDYYNKYIDNDETKFLNFKDHDNSYEEKLLDSMKNFGMEQNLNTLKKLKLLGVRETADLDINLKFDEIKANYISINSPNDKIPLKKLKMKQPFLLPIAGLDSRDYSKLSYKNVGLIRDLIFSLPGSSNYTKKILESVLSEKYKFHDKAKAPSISYEKLKSERVKISNRINYLQKQIYKHGACDKEIRISKTSDPVYKVEFDNLKGELRSLSKQVKDRASYEGINENIGFVRLPSKGKSILNNDYKKEMEHFKNSKYQSTIEGVGLINSIDSDYEKDLAIFNNINEALVEYCGINKDLFIDKDVHEDVKLLRDFKKLAISDYNDLIDSVINSRIGHSCAFISRLAHSLMFYSQMPFNSDYIRVDNLGYSNVLLMVKGGKKIFKSKSSKMFRLFVPILKETIPWYNGGHSDKGSSTIINIKGVNYLLTPWQMLHESILTDSISFYPRICSFIVLNSDNKSTLQSQYHKVCLNVLLAFHNRRQTEVVLANMRYILLSTLGDFTGIEDILPEFFGFNYDCLQSFIRNSIIKNYPEYFKTFQSIKSIKNYGKDISITDFQLSCLKNIFTGSIIHKVEDLTLMIYSTFLMTKAPYQRSVERANNLKGILNIHEEYKTSFKDLTTPELQYNKINVAITKDKDSYINYIKNLFGNDFNIDARYCSNVGVFIDSIFKNNNLQEDLMNKWYSILGSSWDEMATSTGLRGDYSEVEDFWGQKGYFVIYKQLLNNKDFNGKLYELLFSNFSENEKRKKLRGLNQVYLEKIESDREFLIFHAVDKVQWRGGREIYVMDLLTKTLQQPIEKFMAFICQNLDNELISIPSDKRSQVIHHSIFERDLPLKDTLTWYLTLDCSKWAPKSVFCKFIITILSMDCIPNSFKIHFMNYSEKLFYKRIYFNNQEVEVLKNNPKYTKVINDNLIMDEKVNGYYLKMPYSWVMGIFNYTSSFLHAANQKYSSYLISMESYLNGGEDTNLYMFAHSDDSGGRLTVNSKESAKRALVFYEVNLKCCNHLLSKKKSVVSRIYFEILSIIYMFKQLMALLPKFLGGLRFLPSDKGPCQDMSQSYSKCIEIIVAGGSFNVAYMVLKIFSMMIWRFYYNQTPGALDYKRPVQYMGMPDSHPLMVLLCGSDSDIIRLMITDTNTLKKTIKFVNSVVDCIEEPSPIKPFKFSIKVRNIKKGFEDHLERFLPATESWSIRNMNYKNTGLNSISFLNKLKDSGFVGSLVNESTVRRFSRSYFMRNKESLMTVFGQVKVVEMLDSLRLFQGFSSGEQAFKMVLSDILTADEINSIVTDMDSKEEEVENTISVLKHTLFSPIKICNYMNLLTLEDRKINLQHRTLKPTVVQLVKSTGVFSSYFDPTSLVSYIKDPNYRWAIPDVRGLVVAEEELRNFLLKKRLDIERLNEEHLLKICRDLGPKSRKTIYLYSRVPTELRQIKSYSAFLTYLSLNTIDNHEVSGLSLMLGSKEMSVDYAESNINDEIYTINNILNVISVLYSKMDPDFFYSLNLKPILEIDWKGGSPSEIVEYLSDSVEFDVHGCYFNAQLLYLKCIFNNCSRNAEQLKKCAYYTFLKSQKMRGAWVGKGEVYISIENSFFSFELYNSQIISVTTNYSGKLLEHQSDYIRDVCDGIGVEVMRFGRVDIKEKTTNTSYFGFDHSGHMACVSGRELNVGVKCHLKDHRGGFINELYNYNIVDLKGDTITLRCDVFDTPIIKKIHTLPLKKGEILPTIINLLDKTDFDNKVMELGLDSFEEFIYTEILTEYGVDNYIEFNELFDNFASSKLFQIITYVNNNNLSKIHQNPHYSNFPASSGSMTKILVDYSNHKGDKVIEVNRELNSVIMQIRSEYPEQMSVILSEKLVEFYNGMFTKPERREISDEYHKISQSDDPAIVRQSIIKLMTYWGYGGLVNSVQTFTIGRDANNYKYFNQTIIQKGTIAQYSEIFVEMINYIFEEMLDWSSQYNSLNFYPSRYKNRMGVRHVITNFIRYMCNSCYGFIALDKSSDINVMQFNCALLAYLQDEEFCSSLQLKMSNNYILGCLPVSYSRKEDFMVFINVLRWIWTENNKVGYVPNYCVKVERTPDNIPNWKSISRAFKIETPPNFVHYNGGVCTDSVNKILNNSNTEFQADGKTYRLSLKLSEPSHIRVPVNDVLKFKRPIKNSVFDNDFWADLEIELDTDEPYQETIDECLEELGDIYIKKVTKVQNKGKPYSKTLATVKCVIFPMRSCGQSPLSKLRQVGENIILISTTHYPNFHNYFENSSVRIVSFTPGETLICYSTLQNEINSETVIDKILGKVRNYINSSDSADLYVGKVRNSFGEIKSSNELGVFISEKMMTGGLGFEIKDGVTTIVDKKDADVSSGKSNADNKQTLSSEEIELEKLKSKRIEVFNSISKLSERGLSEKSCNKLKEKFLRVIENYQLRLEIIIQSVAKEGELLLLKEELESGVMKLTGKQYRETFLSPRCFTSSHGMSKINPKSIRDKKVKAELDSFHPELSSMVGSGDLPLSDSFKRVIEANMKMWKNMVKSTRFKKDNKAFLLLNTTSLLCCTKPAGNNDLDGFWQSICNRITLYITDDPLSDEDEDDLFASLMEITSSSRLKYRPKGL